MSQSRASARLPFPRRRSEGVALITVLAVFAALLLVATPFALSMRSHYDTAVTRSESVRAVRDAESALAFAKASLLSTCGDLDKTPDYDTIDEIAVDLARLEGPLGSSVRDPQGRLWSVRVEDEQGRINVNSASPFLLGNLIAASRLAAEIDEAADKIVLAEAASFPPEGGAVWVEGEVIRYGRVAGSSLVDCSRGAEGGSPPRAHSKDAAVVDARAVRVAEARFRLKPGEYATFPNVEALKSISDLGDVRFLPGELERIAPLLTAFSARPVEGAFWNPQEIRSAGTGTDGRTVIDVANGRFVNPGTLVRLDVAGEPSRYAIVGSTSAGAGDDLFAADVRRLTSNGVLGGARVRFAATLVSSGSAGESPAVTFEIAGDDLGRSDRVTLSADLGLEIGPGDVVDAVLWTEARHPVNVNTASPEVLSALLTGLRLAGREDSVTRAEAAAVAARIRSAPVKSHEDLLREVLEKALEAQEISDDDVAAIYLNALNSNDAGLAFSTAPFCFRSFDVFRVEATAIRNTAAGAEAGRRTLREVVRLGAPGERVITLESQADFEEPINWSRTGRFMATGPVHVAKDDGQNVPSSRFPKHRWKHLFPSLARTEDDGLDAGDFRLAPARSPGFGVEHFDDWEDPEGYDAAEGPYEHWGVGAFGGGGATGGVAGQVQLELVSRLASSSGGTLVVTSGSPSGPAAGFVSPAAISFWFKPEGGGGSEWTLCDAGDAAQRNRVWVTYDTAAQEVAFRVMDAAIEDPRERIEHVTEVRYPIRLERNSWYHLTAAFRGTKPQDLTLFVDGNPAPMKHRFLTRLTSPLDAGTATGTVAVEDSEGFPDSGVLRIGDEKIEYSSRSSGAFSIRSDALVASGRGARGSQRQSHESGVAVELFGYSLAIESDIPTGGATLGGRGTLGEFRVAALDGKELLQNVPSEDGRPVYGIKATDAKIPLKALPGDDVGNGSDFIDAFGSSGYALVVAGFESIETVCQETGAVMGRIIGHRELIYYGGVQGNALTNVRRAATTRLNEKAGEIFTTASLFPNEVPVRDAALRRPTYVVPLSIEASGDVADGYLDPATTGVSERVQFDDEWARYDSIESVRYFVRDDPSALVEIGRGRRPVRISVPWGGGPGGGGGGGGFALDAGGETGPDPVPLAMALEGEQIPPRPPRPPQEGPAGQVPGQGRRPEGPRRPGGGGGGGDGGGGGRGGEGGGGTPGGDDRPVTTTQVDQALRFRGINGTPWQTHSAGTELIPVFRTMGLAAGSLDAVTIMTPSGDAETNRVHWSARGDGRVSRGVGRTHNFVAFDRNVSRAFASTIGDLRSNVSDEELDLYDSRQLTRLLKFPTGELASRPPERALFGGSTAGGNGFPGHMDEIGIESSRPNAYVVSELDRDQSNTRPDHVTADEDEIALGRADLMIDWGVREGRRRVDGRRYVSGRYFGRRVPLVNSAGTVPYTPLPADGGLVLIDRELVAYSEIEERDDGERQLVLLKGCIRGFLGTEASRHSLTTPVTFLDFLEVSRLDGALSAQASSIPIAEAGDFPTSGTVALVGSDGRIGELVHYTRRDGRNLIMPVGTGPDGATTGGLFRGRFGTRPRGFADGDFAVRFPFRFWDRWYDRADHPEMAVFDAGAIVPGAYVTGVSWREEMPPSGRSEVKMLVRLDGESPWGGEPRGAENGLYEFDDPMPGGHPNPIGRSADSIEVRIGFPYEADAFDGRFVSNGWKETPIVRAISIHYMAPPAVLYREEE